MKKLTLNYIGFIVAVKFIYNVINGALFRRLFMDLALFLYGTYEFFVVECCLEK